MGRTKGNDGRRKLKQASPKSFGLSSEQMEGMVKVNVDAALDLDLLRGAIVVTVGDDKGILLPCITKRITCSSPLQVEAIVMIEVIKFAYNLGVKNVVFKSPNMLVIATCSNPNVPGWWELSREKVGRSYPVGKRTKVQILRQS